MRPVTDQSLLQQLENTPQIGGVEPLSAGVLTPVQDPETIARLEVDSALRPKFQPIQELPQAPVTSKLSDILVSGGLDAWRALNQAAGGVREGIANKADQAEFAMKSLYYDVFGQPEPAPGPRVDTLSAPEGNFVSNFFRNRADAAFDRANQAEAQIVANNAQPSVSFEDVKEDPLSLKTPRFIAEQGARSIPEMAAALIPYVGLPAVATTTTQRVAEQNAQNRGLDPRDAGAGDFVEAAPFGLLSAALERVGAKGTTGGLAKVGKEAAEEVAKKTEEVAKKTIKDRAKDVLVEGALKEGLTEGLQENIEATGETLNTDKTLTPQERLDRTLSSVLVGAGVGTAGRTASETPGAVSNASPQIKQAVSTVAGKAKETAGGFVDTAVQAVQKARAPKVPNLDNSDVVSQTETQASIKKPIPPTGENGPVQTEPVTQKPETKTSVTTRKVVTPNTGQEIDTEFQVLDVNDLTPAEKQGEFQPRERNRKALQSQIDEIVAKFDPERVGDSRTSDTGAPILANDTNVVESGNGRTAAIRRIYDENPDAATAYREFIQKQGFDTKGIERPILVRRRLTQLTPEQRQAFITDSNESEKASISTTERARIDAAKLTPDDLALVGDAQNVNASSNSKFISQFMKKVVTTNDRNALIAQNGSGLSQEGVRRVQAAILAKAYDDVDVVQKLMESPDNNVKAIGNAMLNVAGRWVKAKADGIPKTLDISPNITEAMNLISRARDTDTAISDVINQPDLERGNINPVTEKLIRAFYQPDLKRARSQKAIQDILDYYVQEAGKASDQDTLIDLEPITPETLIEQAVSKRDGGDQQTLGLQDEGTSETATPLQDTETFDRVDEPVQENDGDTIPKKGEGGSDPSTNQFGFISQAFTNRPSWQRKIFADAGVDPDAALNFAPERQFKIMRKAIQDRYGIVVDATANIPVNQALDQMSDLYSNLEQFAFVLGLPHKSMSLSDAKKNQPALRLKLVKNAPYLGVFYPGENVIGLPGRSNSFAHEWGHALDFFMLKQIENTQKYEGMSGKVRNAGADYTPGTASEAWVNLMQKIFFEQDALAAEIVRLETQLEKTSSEKVKADLTERIESIKSGKSKIRSGRTDYYKKASSIGTSYWTKPTEMLARSFEAYIASKVTANNGSLEVLSKGNKGYMESSDSRFVQTFPRAADRDNIFRAYDMLFENLATQSILNPNGDPVQTPTTDAHYLDANTIWNRDNPNAPPQGLKGLYQRELNGFKQQMREILAEKDRPASDRKTLDRVANGLAYVFSSDQQVFRMLEGRYRGSRSLRQLANLWAKRPGSDFSGFIDSKGHRWGTYEEEVDTYTKKYSNTMIKVLEQYGLDHTNKDQMEMLRSALLGEEGKKIPNQITKAAAELRKLVYDSAWSHGKNAGMDIGYVKDISFLNRIMDVPIVATQQSGFLEKAGQVYGIEFENALGQSGSVDLEVLLDMFKEIDSKFQAQGKPPRYKTRGVGANSVVKTIRNLMSKMAEEKDPDKVKEIEQKIQDAVSQIYDDMKTDYSELSAQAWLQNLLSPSSSFDSFNPPRASFLKARKLPKETDFIMKDFMITNPVELMHTYTAQMASEAAYQRRKAQTESYMKAMAKEGVHRDDIDTVNNIIETVSGRASRDYFGKKTHTFFNGLRALGTLYLLPRAVFASLSEAATVGIRTGNTLDGLRALALTVKDVVGNFESTQERMEFAQEMSLVANAMADQAISNRLGGTFENSPRWNRLMHNMFERTLLAPLTRKQHAIVIDVGNIYLRRLSKKILDAKEQGKVGKKSRYNTYVSDLVELGVPRSEVLGFAKWLTDKAGENVTLDEVEGTPHGQSYRIALERIRSESVQTAQAVERSSFAKSDVGKTVMGITSFMFSYFENIVKATPKRVWRTYLESGAPMAVERAIVGYLPAVMQLWMAHTLAMLVRTALFNPDRLEEWEKEGDLAQNLMIAGMSQMGLYGPGADIFVNAFEGVRYQRDLANLAVGPYAGTFLQNMQKAVGPFVSNNSPKTNTSEFGALQGAYGLMSPMISYGLNYVPAGPVLGRGLGVLNMYATSGAASEHFSELLVGPKKSETKGNFKRGKEK